MYRPFFYDELVKEFRISRKISICTHSICKIARQKSAGHPVFELVHRVSKTPPPPTVYWWLEANFSHLKKNDLKVTPGGWVARWVDYRRLG